MNVDQFLEWLATNASLSLDGQSLTGQIGGSTPVGDKGIWFNTNGVEIFNEGAYQPITDVPIGTVLMWASKGLTPPANYLFCDGLPRNKETYAALFAVIGDLYGADTLTFNLPGSPGRMPVFSGTADFKIQGYDGIKGREKLTGTSYGWPGPINAPSFPGAPSASKRGRIWQLDNATGANLGSLEPPQIAFAGIIRYR